MKGEFHFIKLEILKYISRKDAKEQRRKEYRVSDIAHLPTFGTGQVVLMSYKRVSTPVFIGACATSDSSNAAG